MTITRDIAVRLMNGDYDLIGQYNYKQICRIIERVAADGKGFVDLAIDNRSADYIKDHLIKDGFDVKDLDCNYYNKIRIAWGKVDPDIIEIV